MQPNGMRRGKLMEVRKLDTLTVAGRSASGAPIQWTFDKTGLSSCTLGGFQVLSGGTAPVSVDHLFDPADGADKVGELKNSKFNLSTGPNTCYISQSFTFVIAEQTWSVRDEDATCDVRVISNSTATMHYPAFGQITVHWPATPTGITCSPWWTDQQIAYLKRDVLSPNYWDRLRSSYLAGGGIGVSVMPLDLGDEKVFLNWEAVYQTLTTYTQRGVRVIWDRPVPPRESRTFRLRLRVSDNVDWRHLLEGGK